MLGAALLVVVSVAPACGGDGGEDDAARSPTTARPTSTTAVTPTTAVTSTGPPPTTTVTEPAWVVGAGPLPLRPDGFGQVLRTPAVLQDRSLPTTDRLPPPADGRYHSTVGPITAVVRERMGTTWQEGCPVGLSDLRYLTMVFRGFDGKAHTGEMVVNASVADDVVGVFRRLFDADFPLEEMRLITTADLEAAPTGDGNNTAAFVCRPVRQGSSWSAHAYGLAVDVNPFQNPYSRDDLVLPELASAYLDRSWERPGMARAGGVLVEAFADIGWRWGGEWSSPDRMHFSATGR